MTIKGRQVGHRSSWSRRGGIANWRRETIADLLSQDCGSHQRSPFDAAHDRQTADAKRSNTASEESSIATVLTVTRTAALGCRGQHRHFGELVKG
jgi:hypothetical protein